MPFLVLAEVHVLERSGGAVEIISVRGNERRRWRDWKFEERMGLKRSRGSEGELSEPI